MSQKIKLRVDVSEAIGSAAKAELAVTIALPSVAVLPTRPIAIFAGPGGGYSRAYFDLQFEGHSDYSEADYHTSRGTIFVMVDHLGVGESTLMETEITFQMLAAAHDSCVRQITRALEEGSISPDFGPQPGLFSIGEGQSMGGAVTLVTQGRFGTFDAIALCGASAIHNVVPQRDPAETERIKAGFVEMSDYRGDKATGPERIDFTYAWHWEDVPADILEMDMQGGNPVRVTSPYFGSMTLPHCSIETLIPGIFREDAAAVDVPVLIVAGERDVCADPRVEPSAFPGARDISMLIVPKMAHMHNFAGTRHIVWDRIHQWSRMMVGS